LDEDVDYWITHNEPFCASYVSYLEGRHAPGHKNLEEAITVSHHLLLSHGRVVNLYRRMGGKHKIGITLNLTPAYPTTNSFADMIAANNRNGQLNRWFLDAVFKGKYPMDMINLYAAQCKINFSFIKKGDLETISSACDFLGVNYYSRVSVDYDQTNILFAKNAYYTPYKKTAMGWDIGPEEFIELIQYIRNNYTDIPIYITENGSAWDDEVEDGKVHDKDRVDYLLAHLHAVEKINDMGLNIAGYYYWSFMDNFEWGWGYSKRFGLVYIDYVTQERIRKDSFYAYQKYISKKKA
jgi:beta-glucosidase